MSEVFELSVHGRIFRISSPTAQAPRALLLAVHGFTGDEHSMEIFTRKLQPAYWVIYPRAPYPAPQGGYSWVQTPHGIHQAASDLVQAAQELNNCLDLLSVDLATSHLPVFTMGFSQGAALALVYSCLFSKPLDRHALLAGYLPADLVISPGNLNRRSFFIAHGTRDTTVPVEQAGLILNFLQAAGADAQYCASNSTHKLNLECVRKLEDFFSDEMPAP